MGTPLGEQAGTIGQDLESIEESELDIDMPAVYELGEERRQEDLEMDTNEEKWSLWRSNGQSNSGSGVGDLSAKLPHIKVEDLVIKTNNLNLDPCPNFNNFSDGTPILEARHLVGIYWGTRNARGKVKQNRIGHESSDKGRKTKISDM